MFKHMDFIRKVILEEVSKLISEVSHKKEKSKRRHKEHHYSEEDHFRYEKILSAIKANAENQGKSETELKRMALKQFKKEKYGDRMERTRKLTGGRTEKYSLKDYQRLNGAVSDADAEQIRTSVDQENTDIAAVARKIFPGHTDEGAKSQLRKVLNGERNMTKKVFNKLSRMISSGQIATKQ